MLAASGTRLQDRLQSGRVRLALPAFQCRRLPASTKRIWRGGRSPRPKTSRIFQLLWRWRVARPHLHGSQLWSASATADYLSRHIRQQLLSDSLRAGTGFRVNVLHLAGVPRAGYRAAVRAGGCFSFFTAGRDNKSAAVARRLRTRCGTGPLPAQEKTPVVASFGRAALFPATERAGVGALSLATHHNFRASRSGSFGDRGQTHAAA